ncbi:MAG: DsbA family protein, partial [Thermodesulfobacteriota bacterium]
LQIHDWAMKASIASLCAYEQGNDKFWAFHDEIFDNQSKIKLASADETFTGYAKKIGLNTKNLSSVLDQRKLQLK